jgi:methyl-accepting chemotaxis protein
MFISKNNKNYIKNQIEHRELSALQQAVNQNLATIEFTPDGIILTANALFLAAIGYTLEEIKGQHHRIFVTQDEQNSAEYANFWHQLAQGTAQRRRFKRITKDRQVIWIEASYMPIYDSSNQVTKVVKYATDITQQVEREIENQAKQEAISQVMAVIEFHPDGTIITANDNFCQTMGYKAAELVNQHHRQFCKPDYAQSAEYKQFWQDLARGEFTKGTYERLTKDGKSVWLNASYNPIRNAQGDVYKVVKFATDITLELAQHKELQSAVTAFSEVIEAQAEGDLTKQLPSGVFKGALHDLKNALNYSSMKMNQVVNQVSQVANIVSHAAIEVKEGSTSLSDRVQQQAHAVEETSSAIRDMSHQLSENMAKTGQAKQLVNHINEQSHSSVNVMQNTMSSMTKIKESSDRISEIIALIDSIAFQTNLLALNAAVEAARAGEHGRGFAVVASEVRNLAQKSADASKDIKRLIDETVERVNNGVHLAKDTSEILSQMNQGIDEVYNIINEINESMQRQSAGFNNITLSINDIDTITQQNAALVEETAAASESLSEQARRLAEEMAHFKSYSYN